MMIKAKFGRMRNGLIRRPKKQSQPAKLLEFKIPLQDEVYCPACGQIVSEEAKEDAIKLWGLLESANKETVKDEK